MMDRRDTSTWLAGDGSILRMSGFAFDLLSRWFPWQAGDAIEAYVESLRSVDTRREKLLTGLAELRRGGADISALRRLEQRILRARPVTGEPGIDVEGLAEWNDALARWRDAERDVPRLVEERSERVERSIRDLVHGDAPYRSAVFINSPSALDALDSAALDGAERFERRLRQLAASYAQAFVGKCETTAVAGPTNRLRHVDGREAAGLEVHRGEPGEAAATRSRLSYWAALECLRVLLERWPGHVLPRRRAGHQDAAEPDADRELLAACDGTRTVDALRERFGPSVDRRLAALEAAGQVNLEPWITPFVEDPGEALLERAAGMNGEAVNLVRPVVEASHAIASQETVAERRAELERLEERLAGVTGRDVRRAGGSFYSDRFAYSEEGWGNLGEAVIGQDCLAALLQRLQGAFDFVASEAVETLLHERDTSDDRETSRRQVRARRERLLEEAFGRELDRGEPLDLDSAALRDLGLIRADLDRWPLLGSADLMFGGSPEDVAEGRIPWLVVSEVHHILPVVSIPLAGLAGIGRDEGAEILQHLLREGGLDRLAIPRTNRPHKAMDAIPAGVAQLHFDWHEPHPFGGETLDLGDLPGPWKDSRWLYPPYDEYDIDAELLRRHALPALDKGPLLRSRDRSPRLLIDGAVFQRASWKLDRRDFERAPRRTRSVGESVLAVNRARAKHGIPRHFFARFDSDEAKPMMIDAHLPELCDVLMARCSREQSSGQVWVSEMLPSPRDLWLRTSQGLHCNELRITLVRRRGSGR